MNRNLVPLIAAGLIWLGVSAQARVVTVTTADNLNPSAGQVSLLQALTDLQEGDEIRFAIPGTGTQFIATPPEGYPLITKNNVVINGYSQPGAAPNTNPILAANNAQIKIVLDSRNGNTRLMDFPGDNPSDNTGYGDTESAVIGVLGCQGLQLRGVSILATPLTGADNGVAVYGVSFAKGAAGQISGCWIGVAPDGATVAGPADAVTGFRYQGAETITVDNVVVGVPANSTNAPADFNVLVDIPAIPIILEGNGSRIAGNFIGVMPDGLHDVDLALDPNLAGYFEGYIEIGRGGNDTVIGTDGDGVNDANERNVIGGMVPPGMGGYDHSIEFYGQSPGTNIVVAGNYIGVGIDGTTQFTNGIPALNAAGGQAIFRFGSNLDGVSDDVEGNLVFNNWPDTLFPPESFYQQLPNNLNFFDELSVSGSVSARGNTFVNNLPFPVAATKQDGGIDGAWITNYYTKALVDATQGVHPVIAADSTALRLKGTVPVADAANYPVTSVDVYVADPVGIATGQAALIPELPNGFVQGRTFLGSFVDDGPEDADKTPGKFDFDITRLGLTEALITITANYATGPATDTTAVAITSPFSDPVTVSGGTVVELKFTAISKTAQGVKLEWTGIGTLQAADAVTGAWQDVTGASSPYTTPASGAMKYFRLKR